MKNFIKLIGIIATVAVIGLSMTGCQEEDKGGGGGSLTITGLSSNNGKYVIGRNQLGTELLVAGGERKDNKTYGGLITDGKVTLKVWLQGFNVSEYTGSDANVYIILYFKDSAEPLTDTEILIGSSKFVTVTFNKGVGSCELK